MATSRTCYKLDRLSQLAPYIQNSSTYKNPTTPFTGDQGAANPLACKASYEGVENQSFYSRDSNSSLRAVHGTATESGCL
jgi:hypothetical protein